MKLTFLKWLLALAAPLWLGLTWAQAGEPFFLGTRQFTVPESGEITKVALFTARNEFLFVAPAGWQMRADTNDTSVTWLHNDYSSTLGFKIVTPGYDCSAAALRETVRRHFPGANIVGEFDAYTSGGRGHGFDLQFTSGQFNLASRVAFVPFAGGVVEFNLTGGPEKLTKLQFEYGLLLNSFQVEARRAAP